MSFIKSTFSRHILHSSSHNLSRKYFSGVGKITKYSSYSACSKNLKVDIHNNQNHFKLSRYEFCRSHEPASAGSGLDGTH